MDNTQNQEAYDVEEALSEYLKKYYRGAANKISSRRLEAVFNVPGSEIRRMVNSLRCKEAPICSDAEGYYWAETKQELEGTIFQLTSRTDKIAQARDGLARRIFKENQAYPDSDKLMLDEERKGS